VPADQDDEVLTRLRKLSEQLDAAKKSADITAKEIERAKEKTAAATRAVRLHPSAKPTKKKRRRASKERSVR